MRRLLCVLMIVNLIGRSYASGQDEGSTRIRQWRDVEVMDVATLKKQLEFRVRHVVVIRFNYRGKEIRHLKPNWHQGSLWQHTPDGKGSVFVQVMVANKDVDAFKTITTDDQSPDVLTMYGEVLRDSERQNFIFVRLIGRNAKVNSDGGATITW